MTLIPLGGVTPWGQFERTFGYRTLFRSFITGVSQLIYLQFSFEYFSNWFNCLCNTPLRQGDPMGSILKMYVYFKIFNNSNFKIFLLKLTQTTTFCIPNCILKEKFKRILRINANKLKFWTFPICLSFFLNI